MAKPLKSLFNTSPPAPVGAGAGGLPKVFNVIDISASWKGIEIFPYSGAHSKRSLVSPFTTTNRGLVVIARTLVILSGANPLVASE
ncbi:MAG: hypothetical protein M2R45_04321 [Verrucomicrobia subdivision 3 bacterium]|nr:hypothetical protein [Limisphaerales bacterium]MCS1417236.1 hypothetical protein [Limisphaerales bacterium]